MRDYRTHTKYCSLYVFNVMSSGGRGKVRRFATLIQGRDIGGRSHALEVNSNVSKTRLSFTNNCSIPRRGTNEEPPFNDSQQKKDAGSSFVEGSSVLVMENASSRHTLFSRRRLSLSSSAALVGRANLGRHRAAPDNAFFECRVLSRSHALIWYEEPRFFIKDLKSSNGTFVNGRRLPGEQKQELGEGDVIQFGQDVFDSMEKHYCIVARINLGGGEEDKGVHDEKLEGGGGKVEPPGETLLALQNCLKQMSTREEGIAKKLTEAKTLIQRVKNVVDEKWEQGVREDALLSKVSLLREVLKGEGQLEKETDLEKRMRYEENMKKLMYEASRAKVAAELRAFKAEERERALTREKGALLEDYAKKEVASQTEGEDKKDEADEDKSPHFRLTRVLEEIRKLHLELESSQDYSARLSKLESVVTTMCKFHRGAFRALTCMGIFILMIAVAKFVEMNSRTTIVPLEVW